MNTTSEAEARSIGIDLLDATSMLDEGIVVPDQQGGPSTAILLAGVVRARRLLEGVHLLADANRHLEAMILVRALFEFTVTMSWLNADESGERFGDWQADDLRQRIGLDDEHGGLMDASSRAATQARLDELRRDLGRRENLPSMKVRAHAVGLGETGYNLAYRYDSLTAAHPLYSAFELFLRDEGSGALGVSAVPRGALTPDPYVLSAGVLIHVVVLLNERVSTPIADPAQIEQLHERLAVLIPGQP